MKFIEIAKKDIVVEFRSKSTLNLMILFGLITSMLFSVTVPQTSNTVSIALLWLIFIFVGMLGYARAFIREVELETFEGLKISPIHPASILVGKMLYNLVLMLLTEAIVVPIFIGVFNLSLSKPLLFLGILTLGNSAFSVAMSSLAILVVKSRSRELLLPVVAFPVIFPVISSTVFALRMIANGFESVLHPVIVIVSFTIIVLSIAILTSEYAFID